MTDSENVSKDQLDACMADLELRFERRFGALEADVREAKALMVRREGPLIDEIRGFETRVTEVETQIDAVKAKNGMLGKAEVMQIAREIVNEAITGGRTSTDYIMRVTMFAISLGTLIFVVKGGV